MNVFAFGFIASEKNSTENQTNRINYIHLNFRKNPSLPNVEIEDKERSYKNNRLY